MSDLRKAAADALAALEGFHEDGYIREVCAAHITNLRAALDAQQPEPVAWGQIGMRNGHLYLRQSYDRNPYPPPADIARNLALVPLYAAPPAPAVSDAMVEAACVAYSQTAYGDESRRQAKIRSAALRAALEAAIAARGAA